MSHCELLNVRGTELNMITRSLIHIQFSLQPMQQISHQPQPTQQQQQYQEPQYPEQTAAMQIPQIPSEPTPIPSKPDEGSYYTLPYGYHSSSLPLPTQTTDTTLADNSPHNKINSNVTAFYTNNLNNYYSSANSSDSQNQNMIYMHSKSNVATSTTGSQSGKYLIFKFKFISSNSTHFPNF